MDAKRYVYIVEDHPIIRDGYRQLLAEEPDLEVSGMAVSIDEALHEIPKRRLADELAEALRCVLTGELYRHDGTSCTGECS